MAANFSIDLGMLSIDAFLDKFVSSLCAKKWLESVKSDVATHKIAAIPDRSKTVPGCVDQSSSQSIANNFAMCTENSPTKAFSI